MVFFFALRIRRTSDFDKDSHFLIAATYVFIALLLKRNSYSYKNKIRFVNKKIDEDSINGCMGRELFYTFAITLIYPFANNNFGHEFVLFFADFLFGGCKK